MPISITWKTHPESLKRSSEIWYRKASVDYTVPDNFKTILCYSGGLIDSSTNLNTNGTLETLLAYELLEGYGYGNLPDTVYSAGSWDNAQRRYEMLANTVVFIGDGGQLVYDLIVEWANATAWRNKPVVSMTASNNYIKVSAHGLSANAPVMFTGEGTIGAGLEKKVIYYIKQIIDSDNFTVSATIGGAEIDITGNSSGSLYIRSAQGWPNKILFPSQMTIGDGSIHELDLEYNALSAYEMSGI